MSAPVTAFAPCPPCDTLSQPYYVECYRQGSRSVYGLSEWHATLEEALEAVLTHQQRLWSSVALVPRPRKEG